VSRLGLDRAAFAGFIESKLDGSKLGELTSLHAEIRVKNLWVEIGEAAPAGFVRMDGTCMFAISSARSDA
jgi:hypothetical protein